VLIDIVIINLLAQLAEIVVDNWSKAILFVCLCLCVNQSGTSRNCYTYGLVILHEDAFVRYINPRLID